MKRCLLLIILSMLLLTACGSTEQSQSETAATTESVMTWQDYYDLGVRYLSDGNYEEAIIAFSAAIEIDPKQAPVYVSRGDAYVLSGESEENLSAAQADYEKAIELDGTNAQAYLGLADIYIRRGDYDTALEILQDALSKTDNDQSIADKIAEMESGNISDSSGKVYRSSTYNGNGVLLFSVAYTYEEYSRQSSAAYSDGSGNSMGYVETLYDDSGNNVQTDSWMYCDSDEGDLDSFTCYRVTKEYNDAGNAIREDYFICYEFYYDYDYDNNGGEEKIKRENTSNELSKYSIMEYDIDGNLIKRSSYLSDGTPNGSIVYEYSNNLMTKMETFSRDGELERSYIYTYDQYGNRTERNAFDGKGILVERAVFETERTIYYDGDGNIKSYEEHR